VSKLKELNEKNHFQIHSVEDERFQKYGRILRSFPAEDLARRAEEYTTIPEKGNTYVASLPELEEADGVSKIRDVIYGGFPIQVGYCNGRNSTINGFEYHKTSEINLALTDYCLALGHRFDISPELTYPAEKAEFFYVPKGTVFEMYGTTLHLSPLKTRDEGFKNIVILPRGTNTPLSEEEKEEARRAHAKGHLESCLLLQKSKWVISHPEREPLIKQGAHPGVIGDNIELKY